MLPSEVHFHLTRRQESVTWRQKCHPSLYVKGGHAPHRCNWHPFLCRKVKKIKAHVQGHRCPLNLWGGSALLLRTRILRWRCWQWVLIVWRGFSQCIQNSWEPLWHRMIVCFNTLLLLLLISEDRFHANHQHCFDSFAIHSHTFGHVCCKLATQCLLVWTSSW